MRAFMMRIDTQNQPVHGAANCAATSGYQQRGNLMRLGIEPRLRQLRGRCLVDIYNDDTRTYGLSSAY